MELQFQEFINNKYLFSKQDRLLVAVSAGVDSVVLCYLLRSCGYSFGIAHCNFQLRDKASDADEIFVKELAQTLGVSFHSKRFDTEGYVFEKKVSTQVAARELRYAWFEETRQIFDYQWVVTAHHASDNIETVLYHFAKGTGLRGLTGMKPRNGKIVRPLLWAKKQEILALAHNQKLDYREDASNDSDKYARNYIRHHTVPSLQHINPSFETTAIENLKRLEETQVLLDFFIEHAKQNIVQFANNEFLIDKNKLKTYPSVSTLLFEILKDFGFNNTQVEQILKDEEHRTGALFYSKTHKLLIDRYVFILINNESKDIENEIFVLQKKNYYFKYNNLKFVINYIFSKPETFSQNPNIVQLDAEKLSFPLVLRHWHTGDRFQPLGMGGKSQLLSDFFRLKKLTQFEKEAVLVLETAEKNICWVVGFRMDERFKITEKTVSYLNIEVISLHSE